MSNKKILILEGGNNEEHDVSLVTSREIQKILNQNKLKFKTLRVNPKNFHKKIINYKNFVCINALHGPFGEDGQTQKILKKNKIPFSHSNIKSSNLCFNKSASKREIIKNKLMSPKFYLLNINDLTKKKLIEAFYAEETGVKLIEGLTISFNLIQSTILFIYLDFKYYAN